MISEPTVGRNVPKAAIEMIVANDVFDRLVATRVSLSGA